MKAATDGAPALPCLPQWTVGPVRLWLCPHRKGERGEARARELLGPALGCPPQALPLARDDHGRPRLQPPLAHYDTSWSHSGECLLLGLGARLRLGVDLEWRRPRPRLRAIARRFFHPQEVAWLERLDDAAAAAAFVRLWCAKEAVLKAHGHGLSFGLHRLQLRADSDTLTLRWCAPELGQAGRWRLHEWQPAPGYHAALAWYPDAAG